MKQVNRLDGKKQCAQGTQQQCQYEQGVKEGRKSLKQWGKRRMLFQASAFGHGILQNLLEKIRVKTPPALSLN